MQCSLKNNFSLVAQDGRARAGSFATAHGSFQTPAFMPVGTAATVKGVSPLQLKEIGTEIALVNTYHLHLRPGDETIRDLGDVHKFMGWSGPILSDSGGFQVFSLAKLRKVSEQGVTFQSHLDGTEVRFTPEKVLAIQENLGVDIMMVLDECLAYPATFEATEQSLFLTHLWATRSRTYERKNAVQSLFGIVQGGFYPELRKRSVEQTVELGFDGYAIGGLSVGEDPSLMIEMVDCAAALLPEQSIRYLMGVGTPRDILKAVSLGVDLFDCVIPTRNARHGRLYVGTSSINIRNEVHRKDPRPVDETCPCYLCQNFSRAYLSHLFHAKEILALELASLHNLSFYQRLLSAIRGAVKNRTLQKLINEYGDTDKPDALENTRVDE